MSSVVPRPPASPFRAHRDDDLEQALALAAYVVLRHGDVYAPLLDRLEKEMEAVRRRQSYQERARRILKSLSIEGRGARNRSGDLIM